MSTIFFISDLHLGHESVLKWARDYRDGDTIEEHDQILIDKINSTVGKRDLLYILGDVTLKSKRDNLSLLNQIPCQKFLVRGNHDTRPLNEYLKVFRDVYGVLYKKGHWLSHAPIHPKELRNRPNIHGHVHTNSIRRFFTYDQRYINVCVEALNGYPLSLDEIRDGSYWRRKVI